MPKYWEFNQRNIFSELLSLLGRITQENLTHQIEYLKVENEILRKRVGRSIRPTPVEKKRLVKFGVPLGKDLRNIITVVTYETFLLWVKGYIGELNKLGIKRLSKTNVKNILKENGIDPVAKRSEDNWDSFLKRHFRILWACDFFTKQVITSLGPKMFFVLFFINIKTRRVYIAGATRFPNQEWVNKQTQNVLPLLGSGKNGKKLLIRDRDKKFSGGFDVLFENIGFTVQKNPFMSPNMNSYAESWVGTIKRECLNHFIVFGERHLRYLISEYVTHYNTTRPHSSMGNMPLESRLAKNTDEIKCRSKLGGIIRDYYRG